MMKKCVKGMMLAATVALAMLASSCSNSNKLMVGSIIFNATNEWFAEAAFGMRDAAKDLGVTLEENDSRYDVNVEKDLIRDLLKKHASAIVICPLTTEESGAALSEAKEFNVPVVTWNTVIEPKPTAQVIVDPTRLGAATGEYLVEYVNKNDIKSLKAALIVNDAYSIAVERCDGFYNAISPLVENGTLEIVYETKADLIEETKVTVAKMLAERPDIQFIWRWHQMSLVATIQTLKELGRADVLVAGTDMSVGIAKDMLGDEVQVIAVTTQQPYRMGYEAVTNAVKAAKGEQVAESISISTLTYTKEDAEGLQEYVATHEKFAKD